ncbi:MAG: SxtJ family membrane protein [Candidatus Competibacterales bacterium]|nr:SxtJ family membrane protein [Candidatus Competibacterales bacterium]
MPDTVSTDPTPGELRRFGLILGCAIALVAGLLLPWLWSLNWPVWPWLVASVLVFCSLAFPTRLRSLYRFWLKFADVLGWLNTRLLLGLVFFGLFLPIGLLMRLCGKDPLAKQFNPAAKTYRTDKAPRAPDHMEKPF